MCDCIETVQTLLAKYNTQLVLPIFGPQRLFVETMKLDDKKRGKPKSMFASFCPFCGEQYATEKREAAE